MRLYIFILIVCSNSLAFGQYKFDANWVFGVNAGVDFRDTTNVHAFRTDCFASEAAGSISDSLGNLLFYLSSNSEPNNYFTSRIIAKNGLLVPNGDGIQLSGTVTNGIIIVQVPQSPNKYVLFHIGDNRSPNCPSAAACRSFYYTLINVNIDTSISVIEKNILLLNGVDERMAIVRHANGRDWWVLIHGIGNIAIGNVDTYYEFLLTKDMDFIMSSQKIGTQDSISSLFGEMNFNREGDKMAGVFYGIPVIDYFDFDRCSGQLTNCNIIDMQTGYSCEFSPNSRYLYVVATGGNLYQYDLQSANVQHSKFLVTHGAPLGTWQLQIAPDNKIYLAHGYDSLTAPQNERSLSIITNPDEQDSLCHYLPFSFYLGDSAASIGGLPVYPNYNLGPLNSIWRTDAGRDTSICFVKDHPLDIVIGGDSVLGVTATWVYEPGMTDIHRLRQVVRPTISTWYYVTLADSTIVGSCQSREDSVYVEVRICDGIAEQQVLQSRVYPNPAKDNLIIELSNYSQPVTCEIYNTLGVQEQKVVLTSRQSTLDVSSIPNGLYLYRLTDTNGTQSGKVVVQH